jgi:eukaryotic-like serine/threonine-protein kinase
MNSETAPPLEDDTDLGPAQRPSRARVVRRGESRVEVRRRVGDYRIVALLGEGGMAQVHLAVKHGPAGFKKLFVVKSMREDLVDPIYVRSFMHEARLAAQLNHPNVVQTYEVGEDDGQMFISMEYVEGQSMRAVQRRIAPKRLPLNVQVRIIAELARGLHHAHTLQSFDGTPLCIVHRDISPQNVMLTYDGQVKLLDFGIAKASGSDELTREGMIKGKIDYMAPEQLRGEGVDQRADIFALGVMLWEALTGLRFSGGAEVAEITKMHNRIMGREQKLRNVAPETPARLVDICEKAIAIDMNERYSTAEDFERALVEYLSETSKMTNPQQLAEIMEGLFATERKKLRALLEEQIRIIETAQADESLEMLVVGDSESGSGTPVSQSNLLSREAPAARVGDGRRTGSRDAYFAGVSAIVVAAVLAVVYFSQQTFTREAAASSVAPRSGAEAPRTAPTVGVRVMIDAVPPTATATLDGVAIALPFDSTLPRDARLHQLELSAPGYSTLSQSLSLADEVRLHLELAREQPLDPEAAGTQAPPRANVARGARPGDPTQGVAVPTETVPQAPPVEAQTPTVEQPPARRAPPIESESPYEE